MFPAHISLSPYLYNSIPMCAQREYLISPYLSTEGMAKMNIVLKDKTEEKFREAVFKAKGMKKGNISEAMEEAIEDWIEKNSKNQPHQKKP